jgi:ribosomal protein L11 methylase PrmA
MKRSEEKELMDLPGQPRKVLEEDLRNLRVINRWLGGSRALTEAVKLVVKANGLQTFSLLDIGTGSADLPAIIVQWSRRRKIDAQVVGLELDPVTVRVAAAQTKTFPEISIVRGDASAPPFSDRSFDFISASQLLHHFSEKGIVSNLQIWSRIARTAIIVSDLVRHPLAYHGIRVLTGLATRNVMTLTDAPLSVRRAFTLPEWRERFKAAGIGQFELFSVFPFRVVAIFHLANQHAKC